jgi:hypothetical protein
MFVPGLPVVCLLQGGVVGGLADLVAEGESCQGGPGAGLWYVRTSSALPFVLSGKKTGLLKQANKKGYVDGINGARMARTYMVCHVGQSSGPVGHGEVRVPPPRVSVVGAAAPCAQGHVVVQDDMDLVGGECCSHCVKDLGECHDKKSAIQSPPPLLSLQMVLLCQLTSSLVISVPKSGFAAKISLKTAVPLASPSAWLRARDNGISTPPFS